MEPPAAERPSVRHTEMQIDSLEFTNLILRVKCSGVFGIGSAGNSSGELLRHSIEQWLTSHPKDQVDELAIDLTKVDYSWGDGPVSSMVPLIKRGVRKVRLVASPTNRKSLQDLVNVCRLPWFVVEELDA